MIPKQKVEQIIEENKDHCCQDGNLTNPCVKVVAIAKLPSRFGSFQIAAFESTDDKKEHAAVIKGDIIDKEDVTVRIHSECLTGDGFGSLRCDCRDQLTASLEYIEKEGMGVILYLRQEGRGIGLANKIKAYTLQDEGLDTIEADQKLGFSGDERDYQIAAHMLTSLKVKSIKLLTNNPKKISDLIEHGVVVKDRIPLIIPANKYNQAYLETKMKKAGHLLEQKEEPIIEK
jgi:GTP cyclohydrolase II